MTSGASRSAKYTARQQVSRGRSRTPGEPGQGGGKVVAVRFQPVALEIALGGDAGRALVLGGDAESIGLGFSNWQVEAKRARRGCLTAPSTIPEGDLIGVR